MPSLLSPIAPDKVSLLPSMFTLRAALNRRYLMSLTNQNLLQNHYLEAGLWHATLRNTPHAGPVPEDDIHWGWESPCSQVRGHFLGHWMSAAAHTVANTGDAELKAKADFIVAELARCQTENGGKWVGSIPEKYLDWIARGKGVWAPQYVLHKTLMGLYDMYAVAGNQQALDIMVNWAKWFHRWTGQFSQEQLDNILDFETGGMLEAWANLYGATGAQEHLDLIHRYDRRRLFDRLLAGEDALTNWHANTTIPEAHGAARAWEVTGDERWRKIVAAYWKCAVTDRGYYCTGGQTNGEVWTPPGEQSARLGHRTQEHCTVYNMMRLAQYLFRWTGEAEYADYYERNLYNGILAQQNPDTGQISYFLPLHAGAHKTWGKCTEDFWCCHGSLVQAHTLLYTEATYHESAAGLTISQFIPSVCRWTRDDAQVTVTQHADGQGAQVRRPNANVVEISVQCETPTEFELAIRLPWWLSGPARVTVNGVAAEPSGETGFRRLWRTWSDDRVRLEFPKALTPCPLPDRSDTVAFLDGPVVLAGLCDEGRTLHGDAAHPETLLIPDNEREWGSWLPGYRTVGQDRDIRFVPLHEVVDEAYTLYFPVRPI